MFETCTTWKIHERGKILTGHKELFNKFTRQTDSKILEKDV